jgi:hypothetical protein
VDEVNSVERMFWVGMDVDVDVDVVGKSVGWKSVGGMVGVEEDGEDGEDGEQDGEDGEDGEQDGEDEEDSETDKQSVNPSITALSVNDHLLI